VTFGTTIPPAVGLFYTAIQIRNDSNSKYIQTFREIEKEISSLEDHKDRDADDGTDARIKWESIF
jgi:hypothetical protein